MPPAGPGGVLADFEPLVLELAEALRSRGWRIATAESCTGGLIAAACTAVAGSSDWFECGFVTYSNAAKTTLVDVEAGRVEREGAVSEPVARAMAEGALRRAQVDLAVAVTGIAGPGGAVPGKPVGTVWLAVADRHGGITHAWRRQFDGDRAAVREATVREALAALRSRAAGPGSAERAP